MDSALHYARPIVKLACDIRINSGSLAKFGAFAAHEDGFVDRIDLPGDISGDIGATRAEFSKPVIIELNCLLYGLGAMNQAI